MKWDEKDAGAKAAKVTSDKTKLLAEATLSISGGI